MAKRTSQLEQAPIKEDESLKPLSRLAKTIAESMNRHSGTLPQEIKDLYKSFPLSLRKNEDLIHRALTEILEVLDKPKILEDWDQGINIVSDFVKFVSETSGKPSYEFYDLILNVTNSTPFCVEVALQVANFSTGILSNYRSQRNDSKAAKQKLSQANIIDSILHKLAMCEPHTILSVVGCMLKQASVEQLTEMKTQVAGHLEEKLFRTHGPPARGHW
jgi:hypothetical protein